MNKDTKALDNFNNWKNPYVAVRFHCRTCEKKALKTVILETALYVALRQISM